MRWLPLLAPLITACAAGYVFWKSSKQSSTGDDSSPFWLVVSLTFDSKAALAEAEAAWTPLAAYCRAHEPNTLSYELARSDKDDLTVR